MSQSSDVTTDLSSPKDRAEGWRMVQNAPGPETPDTPDRKGRQKGMAIILGAGATFWGAVGAVAWYLVNR
ncbi:hypothetical protein [Phenylobacterium sp. J367]|uniref:hypothetical protein n=1 Tax=Phenylobacterium sp. J367 TaxID=2898435 RepID=UPI0021513D84|nr:hypothetical protein [Phenylobacterium sp. J367]MCR5879380.1 hypothetical protein [Phenylobacterium sp. J367]